MRTTVERLLELRSRAGMASDRLRAAAENSAHGSNRDRLVAKASGVDLVRGYVREELTEAERQDERVRSALSYVAGAGVHSLPDLAEALGYARPVYSEGLGRYLFEWEVTP